MATVMLTTLGGALGGPIGAALGGLAGRAVDGAVFGTPRRQGPRLAELQVQTSSYGTAIPKLFGTLRVAGTVIWATDLRESSGRGGSKATGRTTQYHYSASFAVALSARPIRAVRRIWAEGKLLRGAAGDWKSRTGFRLHPGGEGQDPDPLIASIVGIADAPAHRGIAYAVFEDMALADFGNRIPSLTFEVEADAEPVSLATIAAELGGGAIRGEGGTGGGGTLLPGFAATGASVRDAVDALVEPLGGWYAADGMGVFLRQGPGPGRTIADDAASAWRRPPAAPTDVAVAYHDIARDYQVGVQQVRHPGGAPRTRRIELPAALGAPAAAAIAGDAAARLAIAGPVRTVTLDWDALDIAAGDRIVVAGEPGLWRARRVRVEAMAVVVELVPVAAATLAPAAAGGRPQLAGDVIAGRTRLRLVELPAEDGAVASVPRIVAVAAGTGAGWRQASLLAGDDAGGWRDAGGTAAPGVIGTVATALRPGPATIEDRTAVIDVTLLHDAMTLGDADATALDRGANAALVGDEIVQFGRAERIAPARWRLSRLWRGRRASEWAIDGHGADEPFVLLDAGTWRAIEDPVPMVARPFAVMAAGIADDDVAAATIVPDGRAIVPPAPVHLTLRRDGDLLHIAWVRRGRSAWTWRDSIDVPLVEEREAYRVTLVGGDGGTTVIDVAEPVVRVAWPAAATRIEVRQIGTHGLSRAVTALHRPEILP